MVPGLLHAGLEISPVFNSFGTLRISFGESLNESSLSLVLLTLVVILPRNSVEFLLSCLRERTSTNAHRRGRLTTNGFPGPERWCLVDPEARVVRVDDDDVLQCGRFL